MIRYSYRWYVNGIREWMSCTVYSVDSLCADDASCDLAKFRLGPNHAAVSGRSVGVALSPVTLQPSWSQPEPVCEQSHYCESAWNQPLGHKELIQAQWQVSSVSFINLELERDDGGGGVSQWGGALLRCYLTAPCSSNLGPHPPGATLPRCYGKMSIKMSLKMQLKCQFQTSFLIWRGIPHPRRHFWPRATVQRCHH